MTTSNRRKSYWIQHSAVIKARRRDNMHYCRMVLFVSFCTVLFINWIRRVEGFVSTSTLLSSLGNDISSEGGTVFSGRRKNNDNGGIIAFNSHFWKNTIARMKLMKFHAIRPSHCVRQNQKKHRERKQLLKARRLKS